MQMLLGFFRLIATPLSRHANSRRALAPVNPIARRATSRTVSLNELFARHRLLRYGLLPPNVFAARKLRRSNSRRALAPVNPIDPIARRATSRTVSINELFARHRLLRYGLLAPNVFAAQKLRHSNSRRALAPVNPIARRATSRSVSLNELFARHRLLRYGLLPPNVFAARKLRHSNSRRALAPLNLIARRATSRTVSLNELFALDRPLRYGPYRQTLSLHESCGTPTAEGR